MIELLRRIERSAYPPHMRQMQDVNSIRDLAEYCECRVSEVRVIEGPNYYVIVALKDECCEIVDMAATGRFNFFAVVSQLKSIVGDREVTLDARASTSYPLVRLMERRGLIVVQSCEEWDWDGETMYEMSLRVR
jgi:hypothetical protein